jgi:hypothetical protein
VSRLRGKVATGGRLNAFNTLTRVGFAVASTSPAAGATLTTRPTDFVVNFTNAYAAAPCRRRLQRERGAAGSVVFNDADTVTFRYAATPVTSASGTQTMQIASGAITAASGTALPAWSASFAYQAPVVVPARRPPRPRPRDGRGPGTRRPGRVAQPDQPHVGRPLGDEAGFRIEISSDGGRTYSQLGTATANSTGASVSGLSPAARTTSASRRSTTPASPPTATSRQHAPTANPDRHATNRPNARRASGNRRPSCVD